MSTALIYFVYLIEFLDISVKQWVVRSWESAKEKCDWAGKMFKAGHPLAHVGPTSIYQEYCASVVGVKYDVDYCLRINWLGVSMYKCLN